MVLAPIMACTVKEPQRSEWTAPCSVYLVASEVLDKSRVARTLVLAASAKLLAAYSLSSFLPIWYSRQGLLGYNNRLYAYLNALVITGGALLSAVIGSLMGKYWNDKDSRAPCWIGVIGALVSLPLLCFVLLVRDFKVSMLFLFILLTVSETWFAPTIWLLQASVRKSIRGQSVPVFMVASTLLANLGPALLGIMDPGGIRIGVHLLWICLTANIVAAGAFWMTAHEITLDPVAVGLSGTEAREMSGPTAMLAQRSRTAHWGVF